MLVSFLKSFQSDLRRIKDPAVRKRMLNLIGKLENAPSLHTVPNLRKISGSERYYRIRLGHYRVGLILDDNVVVLVRILHRREIYRFFP